MIRRPHPSSALSVWRRDFRLFAKLARGVLLPPFLDPVIYFLALGFGLGHFVSSINGVPYRDFIAPAMCASATLWGSSFEATFNFFWKMHESHIHENMLATPIEPEDVVVGELLWAATRGLIYSTPFLIVIVLLGYADSAWIVALPPFLFLGGLAFGAIGIAYTVWIPRMDFFTFYFTLVVNPMFLFGGIFFPLDALPGWAQHVAWFLPVDHLATIARTLSAGGSALTVLSHAAWLAAFAALMLLIPLLRYRRRMVA